MVKRRVPTILILFAINLVEPLVQEGLSKFLGSITGVKHVRIPELLNQLCNESQGSDSILRDACYGCFFRATNQPVGYPLLLSMSNCANIYLNGTDYGHCQQYLKNATSTPNSRTNPTTIYCTFLECVRQVNKDTLRQKFCPGSDKMKQHAETLLGQVSNLEQIESFIDKRFAQLRECVGEAIRMFPNFNTTDVQLAQLYANTTACVLAKTRCAHMNPITGEFQEDDLANKLHIPTINALLVNTDYDINIVQMPFHYGSIDVCGKYRNYEQASWPGVVC